MKKRALVSVTDKSNLVAFKPLADSGKWEFVSTGGTAKELTRLGIPVIPIEEVTGFPEMMDGRLKTLHPMIFGGILADRHNSSHMEAIEKQGIKSIRLVVVNLYDFNGDPSIEQIDIGGPSLLRAAAKNHGSVTVLVSPDDYERTVKVILKDGDTWLAGRRLLAEKVFAHTSMYDEMIFRWMWKESLKG